VLRGRRIASSGTLARVLQRVHSTPSHPYPPLRHCAMVGEGLSGPTVAFHLDRPCFGLRAVGLTYGLLCGFTGASARILAPMMLPP